MIEGRNPQRRMPYNKLNKTKTLKLAQMKKILSVRDLCKIPSVSFTLLSRLPGPALVNFPLSYLEQVGKQCAHRSCSLSKRSDELYQSSLINNYEYWNRHFSDSRHLAVSPLITHFFLINTIEKYWKRIAVLSSAHFSSKTRIIFKTFCSPRWSKFHQKRNWTNKKNVSALYFFTAVNICFIKSNFN